MVGVVGVQRAKNTDFVNTAGDMREEICERDSALAMRPRGKRRGHDLAALSPPGRHGGRWILPGITLERGLGSNVSTCDGPPFMNKKMTRLARAGKCDALGARGSRGTASSLPPVAAARADPPMTGMPAQAEHLRQPQRAEPAADPRKNRAAREKRERSNRRVIRSRSPCKIITLLHRQITPLAVERRGATIPVVSDSVYK